MLLSMVVTVFLSLKERLVKLEVPISSEKSSIIILKYLTLGLDWTFLLPAKDFCFSDLHPKEITLSITCKIPSGSLAFKVKFFYSYCDRFKNMASIYSPC